MRLLMQNSCTCWGPVTVVLRVCALRERGDNNRYKYKNMFNRFSFFLLWNKGTFATQYSVYLIYQRNTPHFCQCKPRLTWLVYKYIFCLCNVWIKLPAYCTVCVSCRYVASLTKEQGNQREREMQIVKERAEHISMYIFHASRVAHKQSVLVVWALPSMGPMWKVNSNSFMVNAFTPSSNSRSSSCG